MYCKNLLFEFVIRPGASIRRFSSALKVFLWDFNPLSSFLNYTNTRRNSQSICFESIDEPLKPSCKDQGRQQYCGKESMLWLNSIYWELGGIISSSVYISFKYLLQFLSTFSLVSTDPPGLYSIQVCP